MTNNNHFPCLVIQCYQAIERKTIFFGTYHMVKTLQIQKLWMYILSIILFSFYSANAALCATNVNVENKIDRSTKLKMYSN